MKLQGAVFDFERSSEELRGEPAIPPGEEDLISIYFNEGEDAVETGTDLSQMIGYYIDYNALLKGKLVLLCDRNIGFSSYNSILGDREVLLRCLHIVLGNSVVGLGELYVQTFSVFHYFYKFYLDNKTQYIYNY